MQLLTQQWRSSFGETPPLSDWMRWEHSARWFRIHSLPGSKRYAENKAEKGIVLERANAIATYLFANDSDIWMISSTTSDYRTECENDQHDVVNLFGLSYWREWTEPEDDPEHRIEWTSFASKVGWSSGKFDNLISRIADDEEHLVLWFSSKSGAVFAPYDGGVNVWAENEEQVSSLYSKYRPWMSSRDDWM